MQTLNPQTLQDRVEHLEQTLLAINCLSNIIGAAKNENADVPAGEVSFLLEYLSDDSLYRVEALRMQIQALPASIAKTVPKTERRRKPRAPKLKAVA